MAYNKQTILNLEKGNNALDFKKREKLGSKLELYVPPLRITELKNAKIGKHTCFESVDENNLLQSSCGLEYFIADKNIRLFDNHNHAFYFWHEAYQKGIFKKIPLTLVHIDQHRDTREPKSWPDFTAEAKEETIFDYTNNILNVGNFIPPAIKTGLINKSIMITSEKEIAEFVMPNEDFILDIDLDFFSPEMDYINKTRKLDLIKNLIPRAKLITIATSPCFIDQILALKTLNEIIPSQ